MSNRLADDSQLWIIPWSGRTTLQLTGADRGPFLHNLCTNEIEALRPGDTTEAFVTNVQGKTLGHVLVGCRADDLLLTTVPGQAEVLTAHFDRYLITEDVEIADISGPFDQLLILGSPSTETLSELAGEPVQEERQHSIVLNRAGLTIWSMPYVAGFCFVIGGDASQLETARGVLLDAGATPTTPAALEPLRIAHRFPWFGIDITDDNLPQELNRDQQAISFQKGCYLGQETVARIDALGHVNKMLMRLRCPDQLAVGAELQADGNVVGRMTSLAEDSDGFIGLGFVRRGYLEHGTQLQCGDVAVEVLDHEA